VLATTSGGSLGAAGTISYDDGSITVNYNTTPSADLSITASYNSGDTLSAMPYRVVTDFTSNYEFPEMGDNDADMPRIFTKAIREIDSNLYNASMNSITVASANIEKLRADNEFSLGGSNGITFDGTDVVIGSSATMYRNEVNNPTLSGNVYGWGDVRADGSGSSNRISYSGIEEALEFENTANKFIELGFR